MAPIMTTLEIALKTLENAQVPLHVDDIALRAVELKLATADDLNSLPSRLSAALSQNLNTREPIFRKLPNGQGGYKKGIYALRGKRIGGGRIHTRLNLDDVSKPTTQFIGAAGEHAVFSELLFRGFNASIMTVDDGIDVIASKNNRFFHIQVKTANDLGNGFGFNIRRSIFEAHRNSLTFYILVCRRIIINRYLCDYVILPSTHLHALILKGLMGEGETYSLRLALNDEGSYILNRSEDVTHHVNKFDLIA